jgi:hypothetical protein
MPIALPEITQPIWDQVVIPNLKKLEDRKARRDHYFSDGRIAPPYKPRQVLSYEKAVVKAGEGVPHALSDCLYLYEDGQTRIMQRRSPLTHNVTSFTIGLDGISEGFYTKQLDDPGQTRLDIRKRIVDDLTNCLVAPLCNAGIPITGINADENLGFDWRKREKHLWERVQDLSKQHNII